PGDLQRSYRFSHPLQINTAEEYRELITRHALEAGPIEEAFSQEYQDRFSAVAGDFARHLRDQGWIHTRYFIYFNNKYYFKDPARSAGKGSSLWLLDEPNHRDDARALSFFAALAKRGLREYPQVPILIRTDISRVEWIRDLLAGQIDLNCVSQKLIERNRYLLDDRRRFGREFWQYGSSNDPSATNIPMRAWCWRAWVNGADGIVPWNTVAGMGSWDHAEPLTVFYPGMKFGQDEPFPSIRLKAYRRGQQDVEYLVLLAQKQGWDREAVAQAVGKALNLSGRTLQVDEEDAGTLSLNRVNNDQMEKLKMRVAKALMQ
ncbi:MAG TPA: hypothetical protein VMW38_08750, partial [Terriglobia bacterium]|nr:hypothetical protein [Terriglobia bacterium]